MKYKLNLAAAFLLTVGFACAQESESVENTSSQVEEVKIPETLPTPASEASEQNTASVEENSNASSENEVEAPVKEDVTAERINVPFTSVAVRKQVAQSLDDIINLLARAEERAKKAQKRATQTFEEVQRNKDKILALLDLLSQNQIENEATEEAIIKELQNKKEKQTQAFDDLLNEQQETAATGRNSGQQ